jgi:hypothetical protein
MQWEYFIEQKDYDDCTERELDELGVEGWELVTILVLGARLNYYFKRPLKQKEDDLDL